MSQPTPALIRGLVLGLVTSAFMLGLALAWRAEQGTPESVTGLLWPPGKSLPEFSLIDQNEVRFDRSRLVGRHTLLFFGYTNCPDVCPVTLGVMREVVRRFKASPPAYPVQFVFVSVDPERDSPRVLKDYLDYFASDFVGVSGTPQELEGFARALGVVYLPPVKGSGDSYLVDHSASVLLVDPAARLTGLFQPPLKPDQLEQQLRLTLKALHERSPT